MASLKSSGMRKGRSNVLNHHASLKVDLWRKAI